MIERIIEKIKNNKSFLITSHINLEGDALGSELAFYIALKKLNKKVVIFNSDKTPFIYNFLPSINSIKNSISNEEKFDVGIILDCSDYSRIGNVKDYIISQTNCIMNIDHHISNTHFGDINWVNPKAASTSCMLYDIFKKLKIINKNIALCLYTGIFTDTGGFIYANTTPYVHKIVYDLLHYKIYPYKINEHLESLCTINDLKLINKFLNSIKVDKKRRICWLKIDKWEEKEYDLTEVIFSILKLLKDIELFIIFKSISENKTRINFRSRSFIDVNKIAKVFGGGGHKRASGTTVDGSLDDVERKVISFIKKMNYDKKRWNNSNK